MVWLALQAILGGLQGGSPSALGLARCRAELMDLRKFVVLNYIAVIKAVKKRNRHLKVGDASSCALVAGSATELAFKDIKMPGVLRS